MQETCLWNWKYIVREKANTNTLLGESKLFPVSILPEGISIWFVAADS
jgi:hypothetical protein